MLKIVFLSSILFSIHLLSQPKAKAEVFLLEPEESIHKVALVISLEKDWHVYWLNSGDSGIPTEITWKFPDGFSVSKTDWQVPDLFEADGFISYGYSDTVLFIYELWKKSELTSDEFTIEIKSLICNNICIPFDTTITFNLEKNKLPVFPNSKLEIVNRYNRNLPIRNHNLQLKAKKNDLNVTLFIKIDSEYLSDFDRILFIPYENGIFQNTKNQNFRLLNDIIELTINYDQFKTKDPDKLEGLLIIYKKEYDEYSKIAFEISTKIN